MNFLSTFYLSAVSLLLAQDLKFDVHALKPRAMNKLEREVEPAGPIHSFPQSSFRSFKVVGDGRFRTFKQTAGDFKNSREELVYLAPADAVKEPNTDCETETTADEVVIEVVVEEGEQGVLETIVDTVRNAYEDYVAPAIGSAADAVNNTVEGVTEAARNALDWITRSIWGSSSKLAKQLQSRLAILKLETNTGDAMIVKSADINVKVIRIDEVVYDAAEQALAEDRGLSVGMYRFEPGDLILAASSSLFASISKEQLMEALSHKHKTIANKADALVKAAPKQNREESFLLSKFE